VRLSSPSASAPLSTRLSANSRPYYFFPEGVLVAKKDFNAPKHAELDVKNLHVIKACQSLTSRGYLTTQFSWQYYYVRFASWGEEEK
jgi:small subunit ribosomal protein S10e